MWTSGSGLSYRQLETSWKNTGGTVDYKVSVEEGYKYIAVRDERELIPFIPIGDVHYGSEQCDEHLFLKTLAKAKELKAYILLMGDLLECSNKHSVADGWSKQKPPQTQKDDMVDILKEHTDYIIGSLQGNHENRTVKETGFDVASDLMSLLGIGDRYFCWEFFGSIGRDRGSDTHARSYSVYGVHSKKSSKTIGLDLNATQRDIGGFINADIICKAHSHKKGTSPYQICEVLNDRVTWYNRHIILTGHFLKRQGSYAQAVPMQPCDAGATVAWLNCHASKPRSIKFADLD
jgi:hypothetical protein